MSSSRELVYRLLDYTTISEDSDTPVKKDNPIMVNKDPVFSRTDYKGDTLGEGQVLYTQKDIYLVERLLATGGFSDVYTGHTIDGVRVVIKALANTMMGHTYNIEAFLTETKLMQNHRHEHIVPVIDNHSTGTIPMFYIMPRFETTIDKALLTDKLVRNFLDQQSEVLVHLAKSNIIHGDIKPRNIMVDDNSNTYLSDFGGASLYTDTNKRKYVHTVGFSPPELAILGVRHGTHDIYSFGMTLLTLLTRKRVKHADIGKHMVCDELSFLPEKLVRIIIESTMYEHKKRPSAAVLHEMVHEYLDDTEDRPIFDIHGLRRTSNTTEMGAHESWFLTDEVDDLAHDILIQLEAENHRLVNERLIREDLVDLLSKTKHDQESVPEYARKQSRMLATERLTPPPQKIHNTQRPKTPLPRESASSIQIIVSSTS